MKLSSNSVGMLIFVALATAVFVLMALRPAVDGNAMNFGVPINKDISNADVVSETESEVSAPEVETSAATDAVATTEEASSTENTTSVEPASPNSDSPAVSEDVMPSEEEANEGTEADTEEKTTIN